MRSTGSATQPSTYQSIRDHRQLGVAFKPFPVLAIDSPPNVDGPKAWVRQDNNRCRCSIAETHSAAGIRLRFGNTERGACAIWEIPGDLPVISESSDARVAVTWEAVMALAEYINTMLHRGWTGVFTEIPAHAVPVM